MKLAIVGVGLATPLGRNVRQHLALVGAETALGRSARLRRRGQEDEELLACEWLSPAWRRTDRIVNLALTAAREALAAWPPGDASAATRVQLVLHATLSPETSERLAQRIGGTLKWPVDVHRGGGALSELLRAAADHNAPTLIVAADSWLDPDRLAGRAPRSPWEPAAVPPAEAAAALWVAPTSMAAEQLGHVLHADACTGPERSERVADGAPLTQLLHRLPALRAPIATLWGRTAGDFDRSLSVPFATARAAAARVALAPNVQSRSLVHEAGDLGAAEMTAEMVFALASALASRDAASSLTWGVEDDGRWSCGVLQPADVAEWQANDTPPPEPVTDAIPVIHAAVSYADRSAPDAFDRAALGELLQSGVFRARDRWQIPLREQPTVERRLTKAVAAARTMAGGELPGDALLGALLALQQQPELPQRALAFVGAMLLSTHAPDDLTRWLDALDDAHVWAAAEGLALSGYGLGSPLRARPSAAVRTALLEHASLCAMADARREAAMADWLTEHPPDAQASALHAATCLRAAARLEQCPWSLDVVHPLLDHDDARVCYAAARLLRLHGDPMAARKLRQPAIVEKLGARAIDLAALQPEPIAERWFEQLIDAAEPSEASLGAIGRAGLPRCHAYLTHFLIDDRLADAAHEALCTLFGPPMVAATTPDAWRDHIASLHLDPQQRYRRGKPWSLAVVANELRSSELSRAALRYRLDTVRLAPLRDVDQALLSVRLWDAHGRLAKQLHALANAIAPSPQQKAPS